MDLWEKKEFRPPTYRESLLKAIAQIDEVMNDSGTAIVADMLVQRAKLTDALIAAKEDGDPEKNKVTP